MGRSAVAHSTPAAVASAVVPHPAQASGATGVAGGSPVGLSARVTPVPAPRTRTVSVLTAAALRRALTAAPEAGAAGGRPGPPCNTRGRVGDKAPERDHSVTARRVARGAPQSSRPALGQVRLP